MSESTEMMPSGVAAEIASSVDELGVAVVARAVGVPRAVLLAYVGGDSLYARQIEHRFSPAWPEPRPGTRLSIADLPQLGTLGLVHVTAKRARARGPCVALIDTLP